jgi:hypothetical protein
MARKSDSEPSPQRSQEAVAAKLDISDSAIYRWETDRARPNSRQPEGSVRVAGIAPEGDQGDGCGVG